MDRTDELLEKLNKRIGKKKLDESWANKSVENVFKKLVSQVESGMRKLDDPKDVDKAEKEWPKLEDKLYNWLSKYFD